MSELTDKIFRPQQVKPLTALGRTVSQEKLLGPGRTYPGIPSPIASVDSILRTAVALKIAVETMLRQNNVAVEDTPLLVKELDRVIAFTDARYAALGSGVSDHQVLTNRNPATGYAHDAAVVEYDNALESLLIAVNAQEALDELAVAVDALSSSLVTDHQLLTNRNPATGTAHDADVILFDSSGVPFSAGEVQTAIVATNNRIPENHADLGGLSVSGHPASIISYSNATSGLSATQVQAAIDELAGIVAPEYGFGGRSTWAAAYDTTAITGGNYTPLNLATGVNMTSHNVTGYGSGYLKPNISGTLYHPTSWAKGKGLLTAHLSFYHNSASTESFVFSFFDSSTAGASSRFDRLAEAVVPTGSVAYNVSFSQYVPVQAISGLGYYIMAWCTNSVSLRLKSSSFTLEWE